MDISRQTATLARLQPSFLTASIGLALLFVAQGCAREEAPKYLALGDSYTIGESVAEADRWPMQLAAMLKVEGTDLGQPQILARTGWTTTDLLAAMDRETFQRHYAWVTLMIGVNDEFQHRSIDEFKRQLDRLLDRSAAMADKADHVIVVSIPDWGVTPFAAGADRVAIAKDIDRFNAVYADEVSKRHLTFVDVTALSRKAADDRSLIADDGLHPSGVMLHAWAATVAERIRPQLHSAK